MDATSLRAQQAPLKQRYRDDPATALIKAHAEARLSDDAIACAGVTLKAVTTAMGVEVRSARVVADGVWDARGTLGVDREAPIGLTEIAVRFEIDSDAEPEKLQRIVQTVEHYCVIFQTLRTSPKLSVTLA
jgi:uncharacterized OsmC-like protein